MWGGLALLGAQEPAKYTLGVFMPVLANPHCGLGVAHANRDVLHCLVVQHVRLLRLLNDLQPLKHGRGKLDGVFEPLRDALLLLGYRKRFYAFGPVVEGEDARPCAGRALPAQGREALLERVQLNEELFQEFGVFHHAGEWHTASMLWPSGSKMKAP